jgi:hypothetical protein
MVLAAPEFAGAAFAATAIVEVPKATRSIWTTAALLILVIRPAPRTRVTSPAGLRLTWTLEAT